MKPEKSIERILEEVKQSSFDNFIIREMGYDLELGDEHEVRHKAFLEFRKRTERYDLAAMTTMRRWFGTNGYVKPSREMLYKIIFALKLPVTDAEKYFTEGIGEPIFQISDYKEMILLYGIENRISYETCMEMIDRFEDSLDVSFSTSKTRNTKELQRQYEVNKHMLPQEFVLWMIDCADWFKGYSQTALNYLEIFRKQIIEHVRVEERTQLKELLSEAGYFRWVVEHKDKDADSRKSIEKFVKNYESSFYYNVSENLGKVILELCRRVYSNRITNRQLRDELYSPTIVGKVDISSSSEYVKSEKYLSDLFHIPEQKEREIKINQMIRKLRKQTDTEICTDEIVQFLVQYKMTEQEKLLVKEAKEICEYERKQQRARTLLIGRQDLLPLIHVVAQQQYISENESDYVQEDALQLFENLANATLMMCNMPILDEKYILDRLLVACFDKEEMYSYGDILYIWQKMKEKKDEE